MLDGILNAIQQHIADFWSSLWSPILDNWPLWASWGIFVLFMLAVCALGIVIRIFLPADWSKFPLLALFASVLTAVGWIIGRVSMFRIMRPKIDDARAKNQRQQDQQQSQQGWWW